MAPEPPEWLQPHVDLPERVGVHGVETPCPGGTDRRETALPQHTKVLRNRWLGDLELLPDDGSHLSGGPLTAGEELQDPTSNRIPKYVKRFQCRRKYSEPLI